MGKKSKPKWYENFQETATYAVLDVAHLISGVLELAVFSIGSILFVKRKLKR